ncbi:MAG: response regulator [Xanthomonadales bacterium]|jgi:twitching motility two-component system response regulator PilG|nr:response regulator [Xanthomonadales bacterium]
MSGFIVALCDLQPKDARLLEIVLTRAPNRRYEFQIARSTDVERADIAIVDAELEVSVSALERLRRRGSNPIEVHVSNSGQLGNSKYQIARSHLVLHCFRLLENIAASKMQSDVAKPPAPVEERKAEPAKRPEAGGNAGLALRALVVDDSPTIRTQLEAALQRCGLAVTTAEDGESALARAQSVVFDLIFLDVVMPGMNGYDLCRAIRALPSGRHLPVVMLTSRSSPFDRARGALAGCDTYLVKPVTLKDFYAVVDKSLKRRFSVDEIAARGYRALAA